MAKLIYIKSLTRKLNVKLVINIILAFTFLINLSLFTSCSYETEISPDHFSEVFGEHIISEQVMPHKINIIIDRSASIRGFVSMPNNDFIRTIQDFVQNIPKDIPLQFYMLDDKIQPFNTDLLASLNLISNISFYSGTQTNLANILLNDDVLNKNNLTLVFSDWVHSVGSDFFANQMIIFSRDLKKFIQNDGLFALFGKKSNFNGTYYVECRPPSSIIFNNLERPYFCVVLGNNAHNVFLQKYIEPFYHEELVIGANERFNPEFNPLSDFEDWTEPFDTTNIAKIKLLDNNSISFSIILKEELKFKQKIRPFIEANLVSFDRDSIIYKKAVTDLSIQLDSIKNLSIGEEYFLTLLLPHWDSQIMLCKLSFYQEMPDWISDWSTNCDNDIIEAQKVYQLDRWINDYIYKDLEIKNKTLFTKYLYLRR